MNLSTLLSFLGAVIAARVAWRRGARAFAFGAAALAVLFGSALWQSTHPVVLALLVAAAAAVGWRRYGSTVAVVTRWGSAIRRKSGVASSWDIARYVGPVAMRRRGPIMRPSLRQARRVDRWRQLFTLAPTEVAVRLCRVGRQWVWCAMEEVVLIIGGPRKGKTQLLGGEIIDAPGAVIVTSTRTDLLDQTGPLRQAKGPVYVFNPVGLGERPSTVTFDPLTGCENPVTAAERATDMLAAGDGYGGRSGDREFWDDQGRRNLAALMHAAALGDDLTMVDVSRWLSDLDGNAAQIIGLLRNLSPEPAFEASVTGFIKTNPNTRTSITSTISPALAWLTHKPAQAAALPARHGGHPLDVAALLAERGSVYMLGGEEAQVAPLVCAMTGWIAREARRLAAFCPDGRLDPPLALRLDECALICKVPLHQWTADMGGRGVSIVACFQSRSQIVDHYGQAKAATIINNAGPKVLFGGTGDRDDLDFWSKLAGDRDERITTTDMHGRVASRTVRRVPVLAPAQLHTLPPGRVVVFTSAVAPIVGRTQQVKDRFDVRAFYTPDALSIAAHRWAVSAGRRLAAWAWREALPLLGALYGLWIGAPGGAQAAIDAGRVPGWVGALLGGFLGVTAGLLVGRLLALAWQHGRQPVVGWLARRLRAAQVWITTRWTAARARITGHGATIGHRPFGMPAAPTTTAAAGTTGLGAASGARFVDDPDPVTDPFMRPVRPVPALPVSEAPLIDAPAVESEHGADEAPDQAGADEPRSTGGADAA